MPPGLPSGGYNRSPPPPQSTKHWRGSSPQWPSRVPAACSRRSWSPTAARSRSASCARSRRWASPRSPSTPSSIATRCTSGAPTRPTCSAPARPPRATSKIDKILEVARVRRRGDPPRLRLPGRERRLRARAATRPGSSFIGPPADAIDAMGSKTARARAHAGGRRADRARHDRAGRDRRRRARRSSTTTIGYPVAVKAAGGGGGKGFRVALEEYELEDAFEGAAREGEKFFSDGTVYLERYLPDPRHVEVQVLADSHGNVDPPRRARLLGAAPPPEADRGVARAGGRRGAARADRQDRHRGRRAPSATSAPARSRACSRTASTSSSR